MSRQKAWSPFGRARGKRDNYPTPEKIYSRLNEEFHFDFDPCPINPQGLREVDGMGDWGNSNFVNPPYSEKPKWIKKAIEQQAKGKLTVMLLPVDTSTQWFHDLILPHAEIRWLRGRIFFNPEQPAKFASMLCIFRPEIIPQKPEAKQ